MGPRTQPDIPMKSFLLTLAVALTLGTAAPALAQQMDHTGHHAMDSTIVGVAKADGSFGTLLAAIDAAGLTEALMGEGPYTVFAPTDEAFADLDADAVAELLEPVNRENLLTLLRYHVVSGMRLTASDLQSRANQLSYELDTMGGGIAISSAESGVYIGGAAIAVPNIEASNGIIHVMGGVIIPPPLTDLLKNN